MNKRKISGSWKYYLAAFGIPFLTVFVICAMEGVYPFGDRCILHIDMYHQYAPFFMELLDKLQSGGSLQYSWNVGLGSDFIATYAYYLASPMNLLLVLCPWKYVIEFMTLMIFIKMGLSGFSMTYFLSKHYGKEKMAYLCMGVLYALSGYYCAYYWNIMWLDAIWLLPLCILGLEEGMKQGKWLRYAICLSLTIWSNYYIAIMVCIFLVLYYGLHNWEFVEKGKRMKRFFSFALFSILSAGISAVLIIPEIQILGISGSGDNDFPSEVTFAFNFLSELARHFADVEVTTTEGDLPNIYCGVVVIALLILYFLNKEIATRRKIKYACLLGFFWISFSCNVLEFVWHGFHFPEGLPARQAFLYIFFVLLLCSEVMEHYDALGLKELCISGVLSYALLFAVAFLVTEDEVSEQALLVSGLLFFAYGFLGFLRLFGDEMMKKAVVYLLLFMMVMESGMNLYFTGISTTSRTTYMEDVEAYRTLTAEVAETETDFYRVEKFERLMKDISCLGNYPSASLFSSLMNIQVADAYSSVGMEGGKNFYCFNGATPLISAMLNVKYMLTDSTEEESPLRTLVDTVDDISLYENLYTLPLGFMVDSDLEEEWNREALSDVQAVNALAYALAATEELLVNNETAENESGESTIVVTEDCYLFATYNSSGTSTITVTIGDRSTTYSKASHGYILDIGWVEAGTEIVVKSSSSTANLALVPYTLNFDALDEAYATLSANTMELTEQTDTKIVGTIDVEEAGDLVLSIPSESGWTVYVDGVETETELFMDAFFKISLSEGTHTIELRYQTPGIVVGGGIFLLCLGLLILLFVLQKKGILKNF